MVQAWSLTGRCDWVAGGSFSSIRIGRTARGTHGLQKQQERSEARAMIPQDVTPTTESTKQTSDGILAPKGKKVVNYTVSEKVFSANRRNTLRSTGPRTAKGKAVSRMNAVKHGILSSEVVVRGLRIQEREDEFRALREQCWQCLAPVGSVEEAEVEAAVVAGAGEA